MHQDQRIGLALAILLLGAAGAFFFRNDPRPTRPSPRLKSARVLDDRISEMRNSPYLSSGDDEPGSLGASIGIGSSQKSGTTRSTEGTSSKLSTTDSPGDVSRTNDRDVSPIPLSAGSNEDEETAAASNNSTPPKNAPPVDRVHIVQKGETLSSIAAKELGNSGRFSEIFEANRDQLKDANDVRIGMSLRIPSRASRVETNSTSRTGRSKISAPPLLPADNGSSDANDPSPANVVPTQTSADPAPVDSSLKKKFEPAKLTPLGAQRLGTQSGAVDSASKPAKKLSQLPPKEAGGKVAR